MCTSLVRGIFFKKKCRLLVRPIVYEYFSHRPIIVYGLACEERAKERGERGEEKGGERRRVGRGGGVGFRK